ncbi:MAG: sugar nucleotide-binding protein [Candidatus Micrarchaeota archaeon]
MRIVLLGAGGLLGRYAMEALSGHEIVPVSRNPPAGGRALDAADIAGLDRLLSEAKPQKVINCVKNSYSTDQAEKMREETWRSNVTVADNVAKLRERHGYSIVHISTDWVYEGADGQVYSEQSLPYPQNFYAYTKAVAEERIISRTDDYLILRPTGIFGLDSRGGNFFMRTRSALAAGARLDAPSDQFSQPIFAGELARIMARAISKNARGVYNAVSRECLSRYELALRFCDVFGWDKNLVRPVTSGARAMRIPKSLRLDISKLERDVCEVRPLEKQLLSLKEECG